MSSRQCSTYAEMFDGSKKKAGKHDQEDKLEVLYRKIKLKEKNLFYNLEKESTLQYKNNIISF